MMKHILLILMLVAPFSLAAEEMHHHPDASAMSDGVTNTQGAMAPTGEGVSAAQRCALARRGVVMLDNAAWLACGGKPATVPVSVLPVTETEAASHHGHGGH